MADIDIDPFGEHGRTEEPMGEDIPLPSVPPVNPVGGSTWNQNVNQKHHSEE